MATNNTTAENPEQAQAQAPAQAPAPDVAADTPQDPLPDQDQDTVVNDAAAPPATIPEARLPTRKDTSLREFLGNMDDYAPIIPDAVTHYYMTKAGLPPPPQTDPRLARLLALATQKFIADVSADAYQYSRIRASNTSANNPMGNLGAAAGFPIPGQPAGGAPAGKDQGKGGSLLGIQRAGYGGGGGGGSANKTILSIEDLGMALGEYGVNVKRSEFYR